MQTYIVEIHPFPYVMGNDKIVKIESEKDLDTVLQELENKLKKKNPFYEYDLYGYSLDTFINGLETIELDE